MRRSADLAKCVQNRTCRFLTSKVAFPKALFKVDRPTRYSDTKHVRHHGKVQFVGGMHIAD